MAESLQIKRKIVLDTETTGLNPKEDKIIEIGCVELINDVPSGEKFHQYFNPEEKKISDQSKKIHGLSNEFLAKYPLFESKIAELIKFLSDSEIIIHNAAFDLTVINNHLKRAGADIINQSQCTCTLELAKKKFPGSKVNLNSLCRRYNINLESRQKHGALTDCFLLAQVYLELIGGRQTSLYLKNSDEVNTETVHKYEEKKIKEKINALPIEVKRNDEKNHKDLIRKLHNPLWRNQTY